MRCRLLNCGSFPMLAFSTKYGQRQAHKEEDNADSDRVNEVVTVSTGQEPVKVTMPMDTDRERESKRRNKNPQRVICIVNFFDSHKGWGFVLTNGMGICSNGEEENLYSLYLKSTEWNTTRPRQG